MKSGKITLLTLPGIISLLLISNIFAQNKPKQLKAYLIINNTSSTLKNDSLFKSNLISEVKTGLKKKNYLLVPNNEIEEAGKPHLYIFVDISEDLKVHANKTILQDFVVKVPLPEKTWQYVNKKELIRRVTYYIHKFL